MHFGTTFSPACPQAVKNDCARRNEHLFPEAASTIVKNTYVNDYLNSCTSPTNGSERFQRLICIVKHFSFVCNMQNLLDFEMA